MNWLGLMMPVTFNCAAPAGRPTVTVSPSFQPSVVALSWVTRSPSSPVSRLPDSRSMATSCDIAGASNEEPKTS